MLSTNLKYAWLDDEGDRPGAAFGIMYSLAAQTGSGNSGAASSDQSFEVSGNTMGGVYAVLSKTILNKTAVHMGYLYSLRKTGLVSLDYSQLLPFLDTHLQDDLTNDGASSTPGIFYTGFNTYFWGRNWKFEIWKPIGMDQKAHPFQHPNRRFTTGL